MKTMRMLVLMGVCIMLLSSNKAYSGAGQNDTASCVVTVTVDSIIEWESDFTGGIDLDTVSHIVSRTSAPEKSSAAISLWLNCNATLSANNTVTSQLTHETVATEHLKTSYMVTLDGDGSTATGGEPPAAYAIHSAFISGGVPITHISGDGRIEVTLWAKAENNPDPPNEDDVADMGAYSATQTLTITWASDD